MADHDVPSPTDFNNLEEVRTWIADTTRRRPWRPDFFRAFASEINRHLSVAAKIVELGSGPGMLAEEILTRCLVERYTLVDFSLPMHNLARERLKSFAGNTDYIESDFRSDVWTDGVDGCDAVVTMQAIHEVRHKRHVPRLYGSIFRLIRPGGYFLVADHYATETNHRNSDLYLNSEEQRHILSDSGFDDVTLVLDKEDTALYRAHKP